MPDTTPQEFSTIHSRAMKSPPTVASAATLTPTHKFTFVTGTVQLANIIPLDVLAYQEITLCFTNGSPGVFLTNGTAAPIKVAYAPVQNRPITLHWDPSSKYWWPAAVV